MKWLRKLFGVHRYSDLPVHTITQFQIIGAVPHDITWKDISNHALSFINPMHINVFPDICPECKETLIKREYDWWDIEDKGQYMVWAKECPNQHGAFVEVA